MRVLGCPGQGSQSQGFLTSFIENVAGFRQELETLSDYCDRDLVHLGTEASEETLRDTANAQPLIVGASIATYRTLLRDQRFDGVLGHSVGEFAAAAIAGVLSDQQAMSLVTIRADAMAEASSLEETTMAAILGGEPASINELLVELDLAPANYNGAGQLVVAGTRAGIGKLVATPPDKARVVELKVAGAFHTSYMSSAVMKLAQSTLGITASDPVMTIWSNSNGEQIESGQEFLESLVKQVERPVRWDKCMDSLAMHAGDSQVLEFVELPPSGALSGLVKRGVPGSKTLAIKTPSDVEKIGQFS